MRHRFAITLAAVLGCGLLVGVVTSPRALTTPAGSDSLVARAIASPNIEQPPSRVLALREGQDTAVEERRSPAVPSARSTGIKVADLGEQDPAQLVRKRLRSAIEASVHQVLDPGAILDAALEQVGGEVSRRAIPVPDVTGEMRFPILGTEPGLTAQLVVGRSSRPEFAHILAVEMAFDEHGAHPIDGWVREAPKARAQVWMNAQGGLEAFSILTTLTPSIDANPELPATDHFIEGLYFSYEASVGEWLMRAYGMEAGGPSSWSIPANLDGGSWPRMDSIEELGRRLLEYYRNTQTLSERESR